MIRLKKSSFRCFLFSEQKESNANLKYKIACLTCLIDMLSKIQESNTSYTSSFGNDAACAEMFANVSRFCTSANAFANCSFISVEDMVFFLLVLCTVVFFGLPSKDFCTPVSPRKTSHKKVVQCAPLFLRR